MRDYEKEKYEEWVKQNEQEIKLFETKWSFLRLGLVTGVLTGVIGMLPVVSWYSDKKLENYKQSISDTSSAVVQTENHSENPALADYLVYNQR